MANTIQAPKALLRAQKKANLLDTAITLPLVNVRLGLDSLLGLVPVVGDFLGVLISISIVSDAKEIGLPFMLRAQMLKNIAMDFIIGCIPVLGDIADIFYRSNQKNVRIMEKWWVSNHHAEIKSNSHEILKKWQQNEK